MRYHDLVYGELDVPDEIWRLFRHPLLVRLRGISQAVLPVEMNSCAMTPNRFQHGLGVWHLANELCRREEFKHLTPTLPFAGLLHDAGNPPFSHTGDWFMKAATGHDGETNLRGVLAETELARDLEKLGTDVELLVNLVAGRARPWSDLLNGSLDLDNLDNIKRYGWAQGLWRTSYDHHIILESLAVTPSGGFEFAGDACWWDVEAWQEMRRAVYERIYGESHLALAMMLHRALELAFIQSELPQTFWQLDDRSAIDHLETCNRGTRGLVEAVRGVQPYHLAASWDGKEPPCLLLYEMWKVRKAIADEAAEMAGLSPWETACYIGQGKEHRSIEIPFRMNDGSLKQQYSPASCWRIRIYLAREPTRLDKLLLQDPPKFCERAIAHRLGPPPKEAEAAHAGF